MITWILSLLVHNVFSPLNSTLSQPQSSFNEKGGDKETNYLLKVKWFVAVLENLFPTVFSFLHFSTRSISSSL